MISFFYGKPLHFILKKRKLSLNLCCCLWIRITKYNSLNLIFKGKHLNFTACFPKITYLLPCLISMVSFCITIDVFRLFLTAIQKKHPPSISTIRQIHGIQCSHCLRTSFLRSSYQFLQQMTGNLRLCFLHQLIKLFSFSGIFLNLSANIAQFISHSFFIQWRILRILLQDFYNTANRNADFYH